MVNYWVLNKCKWHDIYNFFTLVLAATDLKSSIVESGVLKVQAGNTHFHNSRACWLILFLCINYQPMINPNGVNKESTPDLKFIPIFEQYKTCFNMKL